MRELKFRAWDAVDKRYYYWSIEACFAVGASAGCMEKYTFEQYTGLKDKNDKEIYEGDIVEFDWYIIGDKPAYRTKELVVFDDMGARVGDDRLRNCTNVEVIGNIHENPELL